VIADDLQIDITEHDVSDADGSAAWLRVEDVLRSEV
jgi:hypothetical protein